jgi:beta-glucosidase/6-phospho-beta-glucosidase/beta-galactosidase
VLAVIYDRYRMPVMVTETSANAPVTGRQVWMDDTIGAVRSLRRQGIPIVGYTWFPLLSLYRWECRLSTRPLDSYLMHLGLYELERDDERCLQRRATSLVESYRQHIAAPMPALGAPAASAHSVPASI